MVPAQWLGLETSGPCSAAFRGFLMGVSPAKLLRALFGPITSRGPQTLVPGTLQPRGTKFLNATQVINSSISKAENEVVTWQNGRGAALTWLQVGGAQRWRVHRLHALHSAPRE